MQLSGLSGTEIGTQLLAARHDWPSRLRPSGRGGGRVYPLEALPDEVQERLRRPAQPKSTQSDPAPVDSGSTQKKPNDKKRLFFSLELGQRARAEAKAEAVRLWRRCACGGTTSCASARRYPPRTPARLSADSGRPIRVERKIGRGKALLSFGISSLYNWDRALTKGGLNALVVQRGQAQGGRRRPRHEYTDTPRGSRYAGCPPPCRLDPPRARAGGAFSLLSAPPPIRPHHPELDETMERGEQDIVARTYAIRTLRKVVTAPP